MYGEIARTTFIPGLTYQYNPRGELVVSGCDEMPLTSEAPARFREDFEAKWAEFGRDPAACWSRLRELVAKMLADLPDNDSVRKDAWLCGLLDAPPAGELVALEKIRDADAGEAAAKEAAVAKMTEAFRVAAATGQRQVVRSYLTDGCHNRDPECSFDRATVHAMPDGSKITTYRCCH